jgi:hypothetical protein
MKKLLTIALLLISLTSFCQTDWKHLYKDGRRGAEISYTIEKNIFYLKIDDKSFDV